MGVGISSSVLYLAVERFIMDPKEKFYLFKKTPNFCSVPWNMIFVGYEGKIKTCIHGSETIGDLRQNTIQEIVRNQNNKKLRSEIFQGNVTENCSRCLKLENEGNGSDTFHYLRNNYNSLFKNQNVEYSRNDEFCLSSLDLHWSGICNLRCVYCNADASSSIAKTLGVPHKHLDQQSADNLIDFVVENQHTLREVYLSGGEPTMINHNLKLLSQLEKRNDLQIRVNSNIMWKENNPIVKEILKFPNVLFTCSAEAKEEKFNYIRRDGDWDLFLQNLNYLKQFSNVRLRLNAVFFVGSAWDFCDTLRFFMDQYSIDDVTINLVSRSQGQFRCGNLPAKVKQKVLQDIQLLKQDKIDNLNLVGQLINCEKEVNTDPSENFLPFFENIDIRYGSDYKTVFKEFL